MEAKCITTLGEIDVFCFRDLTGSSHVSPITASTIPSHKQDRVDTSAPDPVRLSPNFPEASQVIYELLRVTNEQEFPIAYGPYAR